MKIKFYEYNTFLIESSKKIIAMDPGALFFSGSDFQRFSLNLNGIALPIFL